jgi:hypothetical protein
VVPKVIATTESQEIVDPDSAPPQLPVRIRSNSTSSTQSYIPSAEDTDGAESAPPLSEADGGAAAPPPSVPKREKHRSRSQERVSAYVGALPPNPIPRMSTNPIFALVEL